MVIVFNLIYIVLVCWSRNPSFSPPSIYSNLGFTKDKRISWKEKC
jgi:hypothetical protein